MSSEDTTPQQLPGHLVHLMATEVSKVYRQWHAMPNSEAYIGRMMDQAACAAVNVLLTGRVVVDLPEPDEIRRERLTGPEAIFRVGGWLVRASSIDDEPAVTLEKCYLGGGLGFPAERARSIAAAMLAAADAAERLSVPGSRPDFNPSERVSAVHHPNQPDSPLIDVEDFPSVPGSSGEAR